MVIVLGYFYGILRANLTGKAVYFIFDAAVLGFYISRLPSIVLTRSTGQIRVLKIWVFILTIWSAILFFIPVQDYLVQLVGLRGNIFLLPFLLIGTVLEKEDVSRLAVWLAWLNLIVVGFAVAEYFIGVPVFFPIGPATEIIYRSSDLAGYTAFRIPATFGNAHAFAGTMVITLPFLVGAWVQRADHNRLHKYLFAISITASLVGVLMSATRVHFIVAVVLAVVTTFTLRGKVAHWIGWLIMILGIVWLASGEERLLRFATLGDTGYVIERIRGSVNLTFFELAYQYPLGNGLGGGGTSLPYFLQDRLKQPITMENEYARIVLEQGLVGLYLWVLFLIWMFFRSKSKQDDPWFLGKRLSIVATACYFLTGLVGTGLLTSIPLTALLFLNAGWMLSEQEQDVPEVVSESSLVSYR